MSQIIDALTTLAADPSTHVLADATPAPSGGPVPPVVPALPTEVNNPVKQILGWTAGLGLAAAVLGGLLGWAFVAIGHNSERAQLAARGKQGILWSLIGAGGIGVTSALVLTFYNMSKGGA